MVSNCKPAFFLFFAQCLSAEKKNGTITELMEQMRGDGLEPDVDTYNHAIYG